MAETTYTYAEAAVLLRVTEVTLRHWVSRGKIPCHRLGRLVRFTDDDLAAAFTPAPVPPRPTRRPTRRR